MTTPNKVNAVSEQLITSTPEHNVGNQNMTYRMAANAIWNKLNLALSLTSYPQHLDQLEDVIKESRALADSIVHHRYSGNIFVAPSNESLAKAIAERVQDEFSVLHSGGHFATIEQLTTSVLSVIEDQQKKGE